MRNYILIGDQPVEEPNPIRRAMWQLQNGSTVAKTTIAPGVEVSTVFLGSDHSWDGGPPVLWETMIFGGPLDEEQERYTSKADAIAGHERLVARAREATT